MKRFKNEILSIAPPDESQKESIGLFWKELPYGVKNLFVTCLKTNRIEDVLQEAWDIAYCMRREEEDGDDNMFDYTPLD